MQASKTKALNSIKQAVYTHVRRSRTLLLGVVIGFGIAAGAPTMADEIDEVGKLISQGQFDQALSRADAYLANRPNDAQMRFMKGIVLTERNRTVEAIAIFAKLTEDYPELPEPYNNLAVLYAGRGEYDKARSALEMAIRTHPSYATAHENLGDVYAKLASQSYDKALQLDGRNSTAQTKLALVRNLIGNKPNSSASNNASSSPEPSSKRNTNLAAANTSQASAPSPAPTPTPAAVANAAPIKPTAAPSPEKKPTEKPTAERTPPAATPDPTPVITSSPATINSPDSRRTASLPPISTSSSSSSPSLGTEPIASATNKAAALSATTPNKGPSTNTIGVDSQVLQAVERWAKAWSEQNMKVYLDSYSKDFNPPGSMSRSNWEKMRQQRIVGRDNIRVVVDNPLITITGNQAVVKFRQNYFSDRLNNVSQKVLDMKLENGQWRIVSERVGG